MNPKETLQKWEDGVLNYHKTALRNLEQAAVGVNATVNRVERLLGRDMAAGALQVTTRDFAEDTLEQLIIGGKSRSEAMAMMESETFQNDVLRELNRLWTLDEKTLNESRALVDQLVQQQKQHQESGIVLEPTIVEGERLTLLQDNLRSLASIKKFIDGNQDKAQAIGVLLALTQGPKGVIQAVAISAAEQTPLGQRLMERLEALENYAGQSIAEYMEGKGLSAGVEEENYLLGGGKLAVSILGTGISSIGSGKGNGVSGEGAKGIPSINRSTEITELFRSVSTRKGIQIGNRSLIEVPNTGNARIFSGATDFEVKQYFSELTRSTLPSPRSIPGKGEIYVVNTLMEISLCEISRLHLVRLDRLGL